MSLGCNRCHPDGRVFLRPQECSCLRQCGADWCTGAPWTVRERAAYPGVVVGLRIGRAVRRAAGGGAR